MANLFLHRFPSQKVTSLSLLALTIKAKVMGSLQKDEYPNATPAYDSLIANDNLAEGDNYGTSKSYVVVDTPGDIDDKDNPFHATNF